MLLFADLPPLIEERVICSVAAAVYYQVPANIVLAVAEVENGKPGHVSRNTNGTLDVGPMQFNTRYLAQLSAYGITVKDVSDRGCYPYQLATWRIRGHLVNDPGTDIWTKSANYHSKTPYYNLIYRRKLIRAATKWADWLSQRFVTKDILSSR